MANWLSRLLRLDLKASQFGPMMVRTRLGQPVWPERNAEQLAREGYQRNVIAYGCVRLVAEAAASVPWCLYDGTKKVPTHKLLDLLNKPNPMMDGTAFLEAWYSFIQIAGNAYLERVDGVGREPLELYVLRPGRCKAIPGPDGFPQAYEYTVDGQTRRVPVDFVNGDLPILHSRTFNPLSDWYGMSPLEPAAWSIDTHSGAGAYNKALLDNSAVPSGAFVVNPDKEGDASLTDEQYTRLKGELEARFQGAKNAGRPMVLEGGLDWKAFGLNMRDMQFVDSKRDSAREIAQAFGVPPMMLGIPGDNTYSNYQEANKSLWKHTVIPLAKRGGRALSQWLAPSFGDHLRLVPDLDNLDALADERQQQWDRVNNSAILTVNEKREALGYPKTPGGDVILVSATMMPLESAAEPISGGPAPKDNNDPPEPDADDE